MIGPEGFRSRRSRIELRLKRRNSRTPAAAKAAADLRVCVRSWQTSIDRRFGSEKRPALDTDAAMSFPEVELIVCCAVLESIRIVQDENAARPHLARPRHNALHAIAPIQFVSIDDEHVDRFVVESVECFSELAF